MGRSTLGVLDSWTSMRDASYARYTAVASWRLLVADDDRLVRASNTTTQARREVDRKFLRVQ